MWIANSSPECWIWSLENQFCSSHSTHDNEKFSTGKSPCPIKLLSLCPCLFAFTYFWLLFFFHCKFVQKIFQVMSTRSWCESIVCVMFPWQMPQAKEEKTFWKILQISFVNNFSKLNNNHHPISTFLMFCLNLCIYYAFLLRFLLILKQ